MANKYKQIWDEQWSFRQKESATLEKVVSLFRRVLISRLVSHYINKYFRVGG